jgi:hypothetical protein
MSEPVAQIVDLGFSVADGENIKLSYENQALRVSGASNLRKMFPPLELDARGLCEQCRGVMADDNAA